MNQFKIKKSELKNNFTGIYTPDLGTASGCLKLCGLKLFLYLAGNANNMVWTVNPAAYANWLGLDYNKQGRTVRKAINDGIEDLEANGYLKKISEEKYEFSEQKVPDFK